MKTLRRFTALALAVLLGLVGFQGDAGAASLVSKVRVEVKADLSSATDLATATVPLNLVRTLDLASGAGANQANVVWSDRRTIAASTTEDLDFAGGGLTDAVGAAVAPAKVRAILVYASCDNTNNVVVGGDANSVPFLSTAATTVSVQPCGVFLLTAPATAGIAVTAGTGDIIQVANSSSGTSVTYDIVVIGTAS